MNFGLVSVQTWSVFSKQEQDKSSHIEHQPSYGGGNLQLTNTRLTWPLYIKTKRMCGTSWRKIVSMQFLTFRTFCREWEWHLQGNKEDLFFFSSRKANLVMFDCANQFPQRHRSVWFMFFLKDFYRISYRSVKPYGWQTYEKTGQNYTFWSIGHGLRIIHHPMFYESKRAKRANIA